MTKHPTSGLLPALVGLYDRMEADPDASIAPLGFSLEKIHFEIVLEASGALFSINDIRERTKQGRPTYRYVQVPDAGGRSGSGLKPFFCWDNTGYVLGRDTKGKPDRAAKMFEAFRELHLSIRTEVGDDAGFAALCEFLEHWEPAQAEAKIKNWEDVAGLNVVFQLRGKQQYVHQSEAVRLAWQTRQLQVSDDTVTSRGVSLLSGTVDNLARLHPQISGVAGANTTGAAIVSFNLNAFESYGKSQSFNAPVGVADADKYSKSLNRLLSDNARRVRIGDATVVFWSDAPPDVAAANEAWLADAIGEAKPAESSETVQQLTHDLQQLVAGGEPPKGTELSAPFYVLGLSPNASRLHVRFWLPSTFGALAKRLAAHHQRLAIVGQREDRPPPMIRSLLPETAREPKDVPPQLAGQLTRSVLLGERYPTAVFAAVIRRVRMGEEVNARKAAILKAFLIRNLNQEISVALQPDHPDEAYQLGRLFAAIERTQDRAYADERGRSSLNKTVRDKFFGSASATPASVFPRLLRLHQFHLDKIDNVGMRVNMEKLIGSICANINRFPRHLPLEKQGLFHIAYYHQRQDFFVKKTDKETNADA